MTLLFFSSRTLFPLLALILLSGAPVRAEHIIVLVKPVAPFVQQDEAGHFSGYSIDLWAEAARQLGWNDYEFRKVDTVAQLIDGLKKGQADVGVGALSITAERSQEIDFSHPYYDSGLDILVKGGGSIRFFSLLARLFTPELVLTFFGIIVALILVSHLLWHLERHNNHEDFPHGYGEGLLESIWWTTCVLIAGSCMNKDPKSVGGRIMGTIWALVGIAMISYLTATATSIMTVDTLDNAISGPQDLIGKPVATLPGTAADHYLQEQKMDVVECASLDEAVAALEQDKVKAVVYDAPVLLYYLAQHGNRNLSVTGHLFAKQKYGFGLQRESKLRRQLNSTLLSLEESAFMEDLDKRYFTPVEH